MCFFLGVRQIIKVYDFERVRESYEGTDGWYEIIMMQMVGTFIFIGYLFKHFESSRLGDFMAYSLVCLLAIGISIGSKGT